MNLGIPVVMFPFPAYVELTQFHHYDLFAGNYGQLEDVLQYLIRYSFIYIYLYY